MSVKVRYAPSPTGRHHVGGARTFLYDWLFARQNGGKILIRIEDTDQKRYSGSAVQEILDTISWLGLDWDEGPSSEDLLKLGLDQFLANKYGKTAQYSLVQTERKEIYHRIAHELIEAELAYPVFADELDEFNEFDGADKKKAFTMTSTEMDINKWREAKPVLVRMALQTGRPYHIRAKLPRFGTIACQDRLRGTVEFPWRRQYDRVLLKTDGLPTYHLAALVDDHEMGITHVIRGQEWLSSLPLHTWLYQKLDWAPPEFIHTSVILNPIGKGKLSKRANRVNNHDIPIFVKQYQELGFLPEAIINYMALTGWSPGGNLEFQKIDQLIENFSLDKLSVSPARWNFSKLLHLNRLHMRNLDDNRFLSLMKEWL